MSVQAELEQVREANNGVLRPEDVVKFAKDKNTSLHSHFTWDDTEAAKQHRLWEARTVIRCSVTVAPSDNKEFRTYVSLKSDRGEEGGGYRSTVEVLSRKESRDQLLKEALEELEGFEKRYRALAELSGVFAASRKAQNSFKQQLAEVGD